jgi:hypothetical protein
VVQLYNESKGKRGGLLFIFEDWMQSGAPKPGDDWKQMSMVIKLTRKSSQKTKGTYVLMSRDALVAKYKDAPCTSNGVETCVCGTRASFLPSRALCACIVINLQTCLFVI